MLEMIVAMGVFLIVVTIAVGGLVRSLRTIRQITGLIAANGNAGLTLEQMTREIRTGYDFCTNGNVCSSEEELVFRNSKKDIITYRKNGEAIERQCEPEVGSFSGCGGDAGSYDISANNVRVQHLSFRLFGNTSGDGYQPRITIAIGVGGRDAGTADIAVNLQTTVSPRLPLDS